jgi:hypothetical protein
LFFKNLLLLHKKNIFSKQFLSNSSNLFKAKPMYIKRPLIFIALIALCELLSGNSRLVVLPGNIAYIRGNTEIRMIETGGTNDHLVWTHPDASKDLGINGVAWRPDGKELAFSSSHEAAYSLYQADLYAIKPDGSGLRKLTNTPGRAGYANYPKGSVTVTVRNTQFSFQQSQASAGVFIVYVAGADEPQQVTLPPGSSKTLTFKSVADFGKKGQAIVATWGNYRWFIPGTDVEAGHTIKAPDLTISGDGIELLGAYRPVWRSDGSQLSYRTGTCTVDRVSADPEPGEFTFNPMFSGDAPFGACNWDWGPTQQLADQIIYTENSGEQSSIYRMKEGGRHPGTKLTSYSDIQYQLLHDLHWLPDGSGLLYSTVTLMRDAANIFRYDFKTKQTTQVTHLENEFAHNFTISPDGLWLVYERSNSADQDASTDLWIQNMDGTGSHLLTKNGASPSWGK